MISKPALLSRREERHKGGTLPLKVIHQGTETVVDDQTTALIGSDAASTIRIVRPGISRRHALLSYDGTGWKLEDAGSRNGTFVDGKRVTVSALEGTTTCYLGHPTDGEEITLITETATPAATVPATKTSAPPQPVSEASAPSQRAAATSAQPQTGSPAAVPDRTAGTPAGTAGRQTSRRSRTRPAASTGPDRTPAAAAPSDVDIAQLTAAIRDQVKSIRSLTWSVWAMIAVTAILIVLTLFIGILSN